MTRTIELGGEDERRLRELAQTLGEREDALLQALLRLALGHDVRAYTALDRQLAQALGLGSEEGEAKVMPIRSTPGVMGGDACVRNTRIPVWMLVHYKRLGMTDGELLQSYPSLNAADLAAVWDYFASHPEEVERQMREHDEAA